MRYFQPDRIRINPLLQLSATIERIFHRKETYVNKGPLELQKF